MAKLVSPNDLQAEAEKQMLQGRKPSTKRDWELCANFWACNIQKGLEVAALPLLGKLMDCPLSTEDLVAIAKFQADKKQ